MTDWDAVFFDLGGVILDLDSVERAQTAFVESLADERGLDPDRALRRWRDRLGAYFRERDGTTYRPAREGYRRAIEAVVGEPVPESEWRPAFERASERAFEPEPHAVETVERLDAAGLELAVASDIDTDEADRILDWFGLAGRFDAVVTSESVGRTKPDPAVFETALGQTTAPPARTLMVGDRYDHDVRGGSRAGLGTAAYGGSAAERAPDRTNGPRVGGDVVDFVLRDLRELADVVGVDGD